MRSLATIGYAVWSELKSGRSNSGWRWQRSWRRKIKKEGTVVITVDDLEYSYPDDGDHCYYCGQKWDSHSPWEFFYLDDHLLCGECAPEYRRARSRRETKHE